MRILPASVIAILLASSPALASQGDGAKAEDARRVAAQSCTMAAVYRPQCLDWLAPAPQRPVAVPARR